MQKNGRTATVDIFFCFNNTGIIVFLRNGTFSVKNLVFLYLIQCKLMLSTLSYVVTHLLYQKVDGRRRCSGSDLWVFFVVDQPPCRIIINYGGRRRKEPVGVAIYFNKKLNVQSYDFHYSMPVMCKTRGKRTVKTE